MPIDMKLVDPAMQGPLEPRHHNRPPVPELIKDLASDLPEWLASEHDQLTARRDELLAAAERAPAEVTDDDTLRKMSDFVKQLTACTKASEAARVAAKEPTLSAGRVIDGFFKAISDPIDKTKQTVERRMTAYQRQVAEAERRRREEEAAYARMEAERQSREAAEKAAAMRSERDLQEAASAEEMARQAAADAEQARKAAMARAADLTRTRSDYGVTASLRAEWVGRVVDRQAIDLETLRPHIALDALEKAVRSFVRAGGRQLAGAEIHEETHTVVR